jgi:predicted TIM-barrel fold metal-dependent hydrolase
MRIEDLDVLGIDVQLIFSSLFLLIEGDNPMTEMAVKRSYNRWVAEGCSTSGGRLRWVAELPTRTMAAALEELEWAKANGACGIHLHGVEHGYYLDDPYFYPLYERCVALDMPVLVHVGFPQRDIANYRIGNSMPSPSVFIRHLAAVMTGFHAVLASDFHVRFPGLRWGFVEAGAMWVASVLHQHARMVASASDYIPKPIPPSVLEEKGIFIACETDENLPELIRLVGENVLVIGTDYSHNDLGTQTEGHRTILDRTDITPAQARKIVDDNGRKLLGVSADFRPADAAAAAAAGRPLHITPQELVTA